MMIFNFRQSLVGFFLCFKSISPDTPHQQMAVSLSQAFGEHLSRTVDTSRLLLVTEQVESAVEHIGERNDSDWLIAPPLSLPVTFATFYQIHLCLEVVRAG